MRQSDSAYRLNEQRRLTLAAAVERILPSEDGPGAVETGVAVYIENTLATIGLQTRDRFHNGLDLLQSLAEDLCGKDFADASAQERDTVLRRIYEIPHVTPRKFFKNLVTLSIEGFLCDPSHGGNRDALGWQFIGYPEPGICREPEEPHDP